MTLDVPVNQGHVPPGSVACCLVGVTAVADGIAGHSLSNFGALPPEINSGRMYSGPGSGPLMAAARPGTGWPQSCRRQRLATVRRSRS